MKYTVIAIKPITLTDCLEVSGHVICLYPKEGSIFLLKKEALNKFLFN